MSELPSSAAVVVIGGGVMGASAAYHLALRGVRDVVLLESQRFFGQGATGKCAGGIRYQFSTAINVRLSQLSLPMLARFEAETGQAIDLRYPGYLLLATTEENVAEFRRNVALQHSLGAVSYTHLDVYKRQVRERVFLAMAQAPLPNPLPKGEEVWFPPPLGEG